MPSSLLSCLRVGLGAAFLLHSSVTAEESLRVVVIETTPKDAAAIRKLLADPAKNSTADAIKPVLGLKGLKVHGDFKIESPWQTPGNSKPIEKDGGKGVEMKSGATTKLGVKGSLLCNGPKFDQLDLGIEIQAKGKTTRTLQIRESWKSYPASKWEERAAWSDGIVTRMVWHYASLEPGSPAPEERPGAKLEMAIFEAPKAELDKALAAPPADRGKAIEVLRGKTKLIKEGCFWTESRTVWEDHLNYPDPAEVKDRDDFRVECRCSGARDNRTVSWRLQTAVENGTKVASAEAAMKEGEWVIHPLSDFPDGNVLVCRMSR